MALYAFLPVFPAAQKTACQVLGVVRAHLSCAGFIARHRHRPQAFSRRRDLSFARVVVGVLQKGVRGLQSRLHEFAAQLDALSSDNPVEEPGWSVSASAFSQARVKLAHTAFIELNAVAVLGVFYAPGNQAQVARWRGHRLCAVDSSLLTLPASTALGAHFGWQPSANQKGALAGADYVQARVSVYFDLLNRLGIDARLEPARMGERPLGSRHAPAMQAGDLVTTDRGFWGGEWFALVLAAGADFLCRVPRRKLAEADALFAADQAGVSVRAKLAARDRQGQRIRVRLVSVRLPTGELEVLATSLLDEEAYPTADFALLYHRRWGIETYYGLLKGRLEVERWSAKSLEGIRQDFFSSVFLSNVESILSAPAQAHLSARDVQRRNPLAVNRAVSFHAIKGQALALFESDLPAEALLERLTRLMLGTPVAKRPKRLVARHPPAQRRSLHHLRYQRRHTY